MDTKSEFTYEEVLAEARVQNERWAGVLERLEQLELLDERMKTADDTWKYFAINPRTGEMESMTTYELLGETKRVLLETLRDDRPDR